MAIPTTTSTNLTLDTKGSCFMCLKYKPSFSDVTPYSYHRLSKYLQLDFKNVYSISLPTVSICAWENSELVVSLCKSCFELADKFVKLHKDFELIRKRVNTCVGHIQQLMVNAENDSSLLHNHRQRLTLTSNPMELIQASIAENLRKETIQKCKILIGVPAFTSSNSSATPTSVTTIPKPAIPSSSSTPPLTVTSTTTSFGGASDNSAVSSTTIHSATSGQGKDVLVVDLSDSDEDANKDISDSGPELVIRSVTGASGTVYQHQPNTHSSNNASVTVPEIERVGSSVLLIRPVLSDAGPVSAPLVSNANAQSSSSFSALQNFASEYEFGIREVGQHQMDNSSTIQQPSCPSSLTSAVSTVTETDFWKKMSDGSGQCKICGKLFRQFNIENINVHLNVHENVKPIKCQHCNQTFRSNSNRRIHIYTYHRLELFAQFKYPVVSDDAFKNAVDAIFKSNVKKLTDQATDRPYYCHSCEKQYRHRVDVEAHMINVHFNEIGSKLMEHQRQGSDDFGVNVGVKNRDHNAVKNIRPVCSTCGTKFRHAVQLTKHMAIGCTTDTTSPNQSTPPTAAPTGNTTTFVIKWKCGLCSEIFINQNELKRHKLQKHRTSSSAASQLTGITYKCQYCEKKFKFYYSQRVHMLTLHRYQVFSKYVPVCTTLDAIENAVQLIVDQSKVSNDLTHVCKFCNRDFTGSVASIMENHILVNHFQEVVNRLKSTVEQAAAFACQDVVGSSAESGIKVENAVEVVLPD